ncbi:MAG TPA: 2-dehydropantoate 2-reductase [Candidatus Hydrogenedentes bacterium]|nr:2-dehydropantoate 2-reductase [Candidatus Hydrogenedentota bacterium]HIJ73907.1 2-dehydropantoate 2-reductase [Candidatus Hydrogenedentota bacterium]
MRVAIVGPGALGCLFAARLARSGTQTTLVDYRADRAARLSEVGITVEGADETYSATLPVVTTPPQRQDLAIILTKAYATAELRLPSNTPILTLQNGLGNVETLCALVGSAAVLAGTTAEAATRLGEGHVRHVAGGHTILGAWTSCNPQPALDALTAAGFEVELTDAPGQAIWQKAAVNAGINPITALLNVPNGELLRIAEARQLMRDLVVEAVKVATTEGYRFDRSLVEQAEEVCTTTADNISSMLQDVRAGKRTEIDAISGMIIQRAQVSALHTPRTRVVWQLVKGLERRAKQE